MQSCGVIVARQRLSPVANGQNTITVHLALTDLNYDTVLSDSIMPVSCV